MCQAGDGIRDLVRSRGLGDGYERQHVVRAVRTSSSVCVLFARTDGVFHRCSIKRSVRVVKHPHHIIRLC